MENFLIDTHCHLNLIKSEIKTDLIVENAKNSNVQILNNICVNVDEMPEILKLSNRYDNIFCSVGHHPEEVSKKNIKLDDLLLYTNNKKIVAIGESGLDYHYNNENKIEQIKNFELHIQASRETNLPLIIHTRDADSDMIDILEYEMKNGCFNFVLHCFSSSKKLAYRGLDLGGFVSISGIVTFKNADELRSIIKNIPLNKILIETDSPYLTPIPFRGTTNQPANIIYIAEYLSKLFSIDYFEFCSITTRNAKNLFKFNF